MCKENILSYISKIEDIVREGIEKGEIKKEIHKQLLLKFMD